MNTERYNEFMELYRNILRKDMFEQSHFYNDTFANMISRMEAGLKSGKRNVNGKSFKRTCELIGIKPTGLAVKKWMSE